MRSIPSGLLKAFCLGLGLLGFFGLATHAGPPAPQRGSQVPWVITGHFIYVEHIKIDGKEEYLEDDNQLKVEIDFALAQHDPSGQIAVYFLDRADFSAQGKAWSYSQSGKCFYQARWARSGSGRIDAPAHNPMFPAANPVSLTWFVKDKRFAMHFQAPIEKGQVTIKRTDTCNEPTEPVTSQYLWACDIDGAVDYNPKTKTYRFVFLDTYEVPYRENTDLKCTVHVQGELAAPLK